MDSSWEVLPWFAGGRSGGCTPPSKKHSAVLRKSRSKSLPASTHVSVLSILIWATVSPFAPSKPLKAPSSPPVLSEGAERQPALGRSCQDALHATDPRLAPRPTD